MNHKCILQGYSILNIFHMPMDHMLDSKFSFFFLRSLLSSFWVFMWKRVKKYSWLHSALGFVILLCQLHLSRKSNVKSWLRLPLNFGQSNPTTHVEIVEVIHCIEFSHHQTPNVSLKVCINISPFNENNINNLYLFQVLICLT